MKPAALPQDLSPDLRTMLQDLLARAEAAEALAESEHQRAESERQRAETAEANNSQLRSKNEALDKLNHALMARVTSLTERLAKAKHRPEQLALAFELKAVQQRLNALNQEHFGRSSERRGRPDSSPPEEKPAPEKKKGHGPTPQPKLPHILCHHTLDEADQVCPHCRPPRPLEPWQGQTEDSEEVHVIERSFRITTHKRQVYRCGGCGHIETALGPERLIPGGRYSLDFAVGVAADKYVNAQPLASQVREMADQGLEVTTQTLWDQLHALYVLLLPAYLALRARVLASEVVYADETPWRLIGKEGSKRWYVWALTDSKRVYFMLAATRGQAAARQLFGDYAGLVMADRYVVYEALEKALTKNSGQPNLLKLDEGKTQTLPTPDYTLAACWMHGRRGFIKAARDGEAEAETALDLIAELYAIEADARQQVAHIEDPSLREVALLAALAPLRDQRSREVLGRLRAWLDQIITLPGLSLDKAVQWLNNGWIHLTRFVDDARIPIDNGLAERVIRGVVLGRKVYAGSRSEAGTQVAALFYSLTASCRLAGVDARAYMREAATRALRDRSDVVLPEDYARDLVAGAGG